MSMNYYSKHKGGQKHLTVDARQEQEDNYTESRPVKKFHLKAEEANFYSYSDYLKDRDAERKAKAAEQGGEAF